MGGFRAHNIEQGAVIVGLIIQIVVVLYHIILTSTLSAELV